MVYSDLTGDVDVRKYVALHEKHQQMDWERQERRSRARCLRLRLCFLCKAKGHFKLHCPLNKPAEIPCVDLVLAPKGAIPSYCHY